MAHFSDNTFKMIQKSMFVISFVFFVIVLVKMVYLSVGYSYDRETKKFLRTGAIYLESYPAGASVFINDRKQSFKTPYILRNVLPKEYNIKIEKKGFMAYKSEVQVKSASVVNFNAVLISELDVENITKLPLMVYKTFKVKHAVDVKKILFTDKGIFSYNKDYTSSRLLSPIVFSVNDAFALNGVFICGDFLLSWNEHKVWRLPISNDSKLLAKNTIIYKTQGYVKYVAKAFKGRYLIVHDDMNVMAIDVLNPKVNYKILELKSTKDEVIFYAMSDVLEIIEKNSITNQVEIKRIELRNKIFNRLNKLNIKKYEKIF